MRHDIAHIRKDGKEQTVNEHVRGVAAFCEVFGEVIGAGKLAKLAGFLHDMGKEKEEFSHYILESVENEKNIKRGTIDHATAGAKYLFDTYQEKGPFGEMEKQILSMIIAFHHGGLSDFLNPYGSPFLQRMNKPGIEFQYEKSKAFYFQDCCKEEEIQTLFAEGKREIANLAARLVAHHFSQFGFSMLTKYLYSCLIDADRLDTYLFMSGTSYELGSQEKMELLWSELSKKLDLYLSQFPRENEIGRLRAQIADRCLDFAQKPSNIYSLTVPTGGGKTFSSLRFALHHARQWKKSRIIYVVPYLTIIDQNARDVRDALGLDSNDYDVILEQHSNIIRDNEDEDFKLMTERWDAPIVFTSMVQFLETFYGAGTQKIRRLHQMADAVIIFDEVQATPVNCINLFNGAVNFLSKICGTTILLCTATQPALEHTSRPLMREAKSEMVQGLREVFQAFQRVELVDARKNTPYSTEELAAFVLEKAHTEENALVILNTKTAARKLYDRIRAQNEHSDGKRFTLFYLNTNLCAAHRLQIIRVMMRLLAKGRRMICISTQLIEAGVNISFRCVIRSLAGLDSMAQAAGRCNRHGEYPMKQVYMIESKDENVSRLKDIKNGQECSRRILGEYRENPEKFGENLLSPRAMEQYFHYYYENRGNYMDYPLKISTQVSVATLLDENRYSGDSYQRAHGGEKPALIFFHAYGLAAREFEVIPGGTTSVIVPYKQGKKLIEQMNSDCNLKQLTELLKRAQRYSVNLYDHEVKEMGNGVKPIKEGMAYYIDSKYYDGTLGVIPQGGEMEYLVF